MAMVGGGMVETKSLAKCVEAKKADGARSQHHTPQWPPPQRTGREASIHARSVRLIFNISDKVLRCIPSSARNVESSQSGNVQMK